jgi:hypothetical protein
MNNRNKFNNENLFLEVHMIYRKFKIEKVAANEMITFGAYAGETIMKYFGDNRTKPELAGFQIDGLTYECCIPITKQSGINP